MFSTSIKKIASSEISYINSSTAKKIDELLMEDPGFSIDQLMELAGLSVASATHEWIEENMSRLKSSNNSNTPSPQQPLNYRILILCGPGNNGGDGLVAARHLWHFGYTPIIVYPKPNKDKLFINLIKQCSNLNIEIIDNLPPGVVAENKLKSKDSTTTSTATTNSSNDSVSTVDEQCLETNNSSNNNNNNSNQYDVIIDALFGFSFSGPVRSPFDNLILYLSQTSTPKISVDIPSGWDVDRGDIHKTNFLPDAVISLTAPKLCMLKNNNRFLGKHYLGGRFIPPSLLKQFEIKVPNYGRNPSQIMEILPEQTSPSLQTEIIVIKVTAPTMEEAKSISTQLVTSKLAACVNIMPNVLSIYEWEGVIENSQEVMMMIKTRKSLLESITQKIKELHPYTTPEIIASDVIGGNSDYIDWVANSTYSISKT